MIQQVVWKRFIANQIANQATTKHTYFYSKPSRYLNHISYNLYSNVYEKKRKEKEKKKKNARKRKEERLILYKEEI